MAGVESEVEGIDGTTRLEAYGVVVLEHLAGIRHHGVAHSLFLLGSCLQLLVLYTLFKIAI